MLLKRQYDIPVGWEPQRAPDGMLTNPLPVQSLSLKHTGTHPEQNFSRRLVETGLIEGWVSMSQGTLVVHTDEEDLKYTIVRMPGIYCCHCAAKLDDDATGASGRAHMHTMHADTASPDTTNPAGFRQTHAYECVLDAEQHATWQVGTGEKVRLPYRKAR